MFKKTLLSAAALLAAGTLSASVFAAPVTAEGTGVGKHGDITVAVMGCVVNGPGEAHEADYGIAGGKDCGLLFRRGEILGKYPADKLADALVDLILSEK